jgi:hypothetical protein
MTDISKNDTQSEQQFRIRRHSLLWSIVLLIISCLIIWAGVAVKNDVFGEILKALGGGLIVFALIETLLQKGIEKAERRLAGWTPQLEKMHAELVAANETLQKSTDGALQLVRDTRLSYIPEILSGILDIEKQLNVLERRAMWLEVRSMATGGDEELDALWRSHIKKTEFSLRIVEQVANERNEKDKDQGG